MWKRVWKSRPRPGTLVSAPLIVIAHPPLELHGLIWVAVVPWLWTLSRCASWKDAVAQGLWLNFLLGLGGAFWVAVAVPSYLDVSPAFGLFAMLLHASVHQLQLVVFAPIFRRLSGSGSHALGPHLVLLAAFAYTGLDWIVPNLFQDTFGFVLHDYASFRQLAEFGGAPLLTFLVLVANLCLFATLERAVGEHRSRGLRHALVPVGLAAVVIGGAWGIGSQRNQQVSASIAAPVKRITVGMVQGNVSRALKSRWARGDADAAREALTLYLEASNELLEGPSRPAFIVWPETAYPGIFRRPENEEQARINVVMDKFVARSGTPFVFGAYDREDRVDRRVLRNAVFFVEPRPGQSIRALSPMQVYHKHILFPVGEYLPFVGERFTREWLPQAATFSTGEGPRTFEIGTAADGPIRLGPSICYEDLFPSHAIALARGGADILVNVSNDSWFGNYGLPQFHLIAAKLRSIETRLPQVRVTNTGYSALILPNGDAAVPFPYGARGATGVRVPIIERGDTLMIRWGDWFGGASLVVAAGGLLLAGRPGPRRP